MSYPDDTIDWQAIENIHRWLDDGLPQGYRDQPLALIWARIAKIGEEYGEVVAAQIGATGQNPRKGFTHTPDGVCQELADVVVTAIVAMMAVTEGYPQACRSYIMDKVAALEDRTMQR